MDREAGRAPILLLVSPDGKHLLDLCLREVLPTEGYRSFDQRIGDVDGVVGRSEVVAIVRATVAPVALGEEAIDAELGAKLPSCWPAAATSPASTTPSRRTCRWKRLGTTWRGVGACTDEFVGRGGRRGLGRNRPQ